MKKAMLLAAAALVITAGQALGQTISQGMTSAQVREAFGAPATTRAAGDWTYWYYHNGCPRRCGSDDVVFFENDRVVAAVLRTSRRRYSGPAADAALEARDDGTSSVRSGADAVERTEVVRVGGVRVDDGGPPAGADVIIVPAPADAVEGTPVPAREGRAGEPSTITISGDAADANATTVTPDVTVTPTTTGTTTTTGTADPAAPARNSEAADVNGQTSVDRKADRVQEQQRRRPTATERARQNDRKP